MHRCSSLAIPEKSTEYSIFHFYLFSFMFCAKSFAAAGLEHMLIYWFDCLFLNIYFGNFVVICCVLLRFCGKIQSEESKDLHN